MLLLFLHVLAVLTIIGVLHVVVVVVVFCSYTYMLFMLLLLLFGMIFLPSNVKFRQEVCQRTDWNELFFSPENCPRRTNFSDEDNYLPQQLPQPRFFFLELEKIQ